MKTLTFVPYPHNVKCWPWVDRLAPCEEACPLHTDVVGYVKAIAAGKFSEALAIIRQSNPLPSICAYVCHHPCEKTCNRGIIDEPVAIKWLKRFAVDDSLAKKPVKPAPAKRTKKEKIAIIGSGPAGLTAAHDLVTKGYGVTIYEALAVPGGIPAIAIPEFIMPQEAVQRDIDYIKDLGVDIQTNISIGQDITLDKLRQFGYQAIFLAIGTWESQKISIPGEDADEVFNAISLLKASKLNESVGLTAIRGKTVVIGGGNTAIDAARTALRLGSQEVTILYRRSRAEMPARNDEIVAAENEGVKIDYLVTPTAILSARRKVQALKCTRMELLWPDSSGRRIPSPVQGSDFLIQVDAVILATGQAPHWSSLARNNGIKNTQRGTIAIASDSFATNLPDVFAGGDAVTGPATVTEAMATGRQVAISIDRYLQKKQLKNDRQEPPKEVIEIEDKMVPNYIPRLARWEMPRLAVSDRIRSFKDTDMGYQDWQAIREAKRCLNCKMCGSCIFERGQICNDMASQLIRI